MNTTIDGFDWDDGNIRKCRKHGGDIVEVEHALRGPIGVFPDFAHSAAEERFKAIGRTQQGRHVLIVFTLRIRHEKPLIRPISARFMHDNEVKHYEKALAGAGNR